MLEFSVMLVSWIIGIAVIMAVIRFVFAVIRFIFKVNAIERKLESILVVNSRIFSALEDILQTIKKE